MRTWGRADPDTVAIRWGRPMRYWAHSGLAAAVLALIAASPMKAVALDMPGPSAQEVLVKSILVTLNDAVASDNFTILHAKISQPFRAHYAPEKQRAVFTDRRAATALVCAVVAANMTPDEDARIDEQG